MAGQIAIDQRTGNGIFGGNLRQVICGVPAGILEFIAIDVEFSSGIVRSEAGFAALGIIDEGFVSEFTSTETVSVLREIVLKSSIHSSSTHHGSSACAKGPSAVFPAAKLAGG